MQIYLPARFNRAQRYPLLVVHDGTDYLNFAAMKTVLDNLIHRLDVDPLVAVFLPPPVGATPVAGIEVTRPPWNFWWLYTLEDWFGLPAILFV